MCAAIDKVRDKFESVEIAEPMLGEVGSDATVINADKEAVAKAVVAAALSESGYESTAAAKEAGAVASSAVSANTISPSCSREVIYLSAILSSEIYGISSRVTSVYSPNLIRTSP